MDRYIVLQERPADFSEGELLVVLREFRVNSDDEALSAFHAFIEEHCREPLIPVQMSLHKLGTSLNSASVHTDIPVVKEVTVAYWR